MKEHEVVTLTKDWRGHEAGTRVTIVHVHTDNPDVVWVECSHCNLVFDVQKEDLQNIIYL